MSQCPCGSNMVFDQCCGPLLSGERNPPTAEALMRARYSAFAKAEIDFLTESLHPAHRHDHDAAATRRWVQNSEWLDLEILSCDAGGEQDEEGMVEFIATFKEKGAVRRHHERSIFSKKNGRWYFVEGSMVTTDTQVRESPKIGRNESCPCGSGKKYKKCCG